MGLTIVTVVADKTYTINGISTGEPLFASSVNSTTVRLTEKILGSSYNAVTVSAFSDFSIDAVNPTDVDDAVEKINNITNF
jgi:hypothetical protein